MRLCGAPRFHDPLPTSCDTFGPRKRLITLLPFRGRFLVTLRLCFNCAMPAAFHPAVTQWFARTFAAPTAAQSADWPAIAARRHVLIAAPTGSGKTLAAFLAVIDELVRTGVAAAGLLPDETLVVYVSPLKALSNDIHRTLEEPLAGRPLTRVGLSATQKPIGEVARFLVGTRKLRPDGAPDCTIIDSGHVRERDLQLEIPAAPLEAVMSGEVWTQLYERLAQLVSEHRTTLVFVNTRRQAERIARHLSERLGEQHVTAHHGSMAKESRLDAEARLKRGELRALVATASLELGIDIGEVNLVCQLGSPRSIAALLQRVGRSGHSVGGTPKGRLFPLSRDDLVECAALLAAVRRGELDRVAVPAKPLDVLAQQIVAEVAAREWDEAGLYDLLRGAYPCRDLERAEFDEVVRMLAEGYSTRRGRRGALVHH